jgi:hypothetical protein
VAREYPRVGVCSKGEEVIECQLVLQSILEGEIIEHLRNMQARSAYADLFSVISHSACLYREIL